MASEPQTEPTYYCPTCGVGVDPEKVHQGQINTFHIAKVEKPGCKPCPGRFVPHVVVRLPEGAEK